VKRLQGNFTLLFSHFPYPTLLPIFSLLSLDLLPFFPPLQLLHPLFLFPPGGWLPFELVEDCTECTSADCVGIENKDESGHPTDWLKDNSFN
jgi:hypothetical protein